MVPALAYLDEWAGFSADAITGVNQGICARALIKDHAPPCRRAKERGHVERRAPARAPRALGAPGGATAGTSRGGLKELGHGLGGGTRAWPLSCYSPARILAVGEAFHHEEQSGAGTRHIVPAGTSTCVENM